MRPSTVTRATMLWKDMRPSPQGTDKPRPLHQVVTLPILPIKATWDRVDNLAQIVAQSMGTTHLVDLHQLLCYVVINPMYHLHLTTSPLGRCTSHELLESKYAVPTDGESQRCVYPQTGSGEQTWEVTVGTVASQTSGAVGQIVALIYKQGRQLSNDASLRVLAKINSGLCCFICTAMGMLQG